MDQDLINNRYEVVRSLGRGGMGEVLLVRDLERGGREVALKSFAVRRHIEESLDHFKREFLVLSKLRHPNLAEVYDFGVMDRPASGEGNGTGNRTGTLFFTTEYVEGPDLLEATEDMAWPDLWAILVQICRGLDYIHARGLVHSDVKPSNILISPLGDEDAGEGAGRRVRLIDFGLAGEATRPPEEIRGTVSYMAPEVATHGPVDRRADLYSLGCTLYHVATRTLPFEGETNIDVIRQQVETRPAPPRDVRPEIPRALEELILRLLSKEPRDRFEGGEAIIRFINRRTGRQHAVETAATRESYARSGRFVGRDDELARLVEAFRDAFPGRAVDAGEDLSGGLDLRPTDDPVAPSLCLVRGEGGIGKTRLVRELKNRAQLARVECLWGRAYPDAAGPYALWRDIVRSFLLGRESEDADRIRRELRGLFRAAEDEEPPPSPGAEPAPALTPDEARIRLFEGIARLTLEAVEERPTVVILEDIHWADDGSIELLHYVARTIRLAARSAREKGGDPDEDGAGRVADEASGPGPPSILLVATTRDTDIEPGPGAERFRDQIGSLRAEPFVRDVHLERLDREAVRDLVASIVQVSDRGRELADRIYDETRGNPYFVEEVMRSLLEEGVLVHESGAWRVEVDDLSSLRLPSDVEDVLVDRVARLGGEDMDVISVLAVHRRPMTAEEFASIAGMETAEVRRRLEALARRQILFAEPSPPGVPPRYAFIHDLARQTVYLRMSPEERAERHARAADALLRKGRRTGRWDSGELAHHLEAAGRPREAALHAEAAAGEALDIYANRRAIDLFDMAVRLIDRALEAEELPPEDEGPVFADEAPPPDALLPDAEEEPDLRARRLALLERRCEALVRVGEYDRAVAGYEEILELPAERLGPEHRATVHRHLGEVRAMQGLLDDALDAHSVALRVLGDELRSLEGVRILNETGQIYVRKGLYDKAIEFCRSGLDLLAGLDADGTNEQAALWNTLGTARACKGEYQAAREQFEKALAIRRSRNDLSGIAESTACLGDVLCDTERPDRAIECFQEALEIKERTGDVRGIAEAAASLGAAYHSLGQTALALEHHERALRIRERIGDVGGAVASRNRIAEVYLAGATYEPALEQLERALEAARSGGAEAEGREAVLTLTHLARALRILGDLDRAAEHGQEARQVADRRGMRREQAAAEAALAEVALARDEEDEAERRLSEAVTIYDGMEDRTGLARALLDLVHLYRRRGDRELAERVFRKVASLSEDLPGRSVKARVLMARALLDAEVSPSAAERDLEEALDIVEEMRRPELIWRIHQALGKVREAAGAPEAAASSHVRAMESIRRIWARVPERHKKGYLEVPERRAVREDFRRARESVLLEDGGG